MQKKEMWASQQRVKGQGKAISVLCCRLLLAIFTALIMMGNVSTAGELLVVEWGDDPYEICSIDLLIDVPEPGSISTTYVASTISGITCNFDADMLVSLSRGITAVDSMSISIVNGGTQNAPGDDISLNITVEMDGAGLRALYPDGGDYIKVGEMRMLASPQSGATPGTLSGYGIDSWWLEFLGLEEEDQAYYIVYENQDCVCLTASDAVDEYTLTLSSTDGGSVSSPGEGDFLYCDGSVADANSATTTVTVSEDVEVQAVFAMDEIDEETYTLTLSSTTGGRIVSPGEGEIVVEAGSLVLLQAEPTNDLFEFSHFEGNFWANVSPYRLTVNQDYTIRAVFTSLLDVLVVDAGVSEDRTQNGTDEYPFDTIQEAIEVAASGATIVIRSGHYVENLDLSRKFLTLTGVDVNDWGFPVIQGAGDGPVITVSNVTDSNTLLQGLVITQGDGRLASGLNCTASQLTLANCLMVANRCDSVHGQGGALRAYESHVNLINCTVSGNYGGVSGAALYAGSNSEVTVLDSIVWDNEPNEVLYDETSDVVVEYSDVAGGFAGLGNLDVDPDFVAPGHWEHALNPGMAVSPSHTYAIWIDGDYHVNATSPCIDAGDPSATYDLEFDPNGERVNLGVYGNTPDATVTPGE